MSSPDDDKIIRLVHSSPATREESVSMHACSACRNKTFLVVARSEPDLPMLRCAACGQDIGAIGWAHGDSWGMGDG